jgi:hypothetical protein
LAITCRAILLRVLHHAAMLHTVPGTYMQLGQKPV